MTDTHVEGHGSPSNDLQRGQNIGRYLVLDRLGAGAMGVVFAAYDPELDRRVAIKVLHARHGSERAQARLVREAQALARVTHPCVVVVHDVGLHEGRVFLAMEYVQGRTLRGFSTERSHGLDERLRVLVRAGEGLAAAHRAGLVHRDFKPDNVMIGAEGAVKVMDFGLARAREDEGEGDTSDGDIVTLNSRRVGPSDLTHEGAMIGTPAYMAPEQLASLPADARSDQFAFAVTVYETLYGVRPFSGSNLTALAVAIQDGRIGDPPKQHRVPPWLRRVVLRGLAANPSMRWPDVDSMLAAMVSDPVRARRRRWFGGAALGLSAGVGAVIAAWLVAPPEPPAVCTDLVDGIEGRWTEHEREDLELILGRDAGTRASTISVLHSLDAYASAWDGANADNCTASHGEQAQSGRVHDLRADCLRHRRIAFEQLVALLGDTRVGDPKAQERAVEAAARLPEIAACSDVAALELEPELPTEPELRGQVEALRDEIAAIESLVEMRRSEPALARAREVSARAEAIGHRPVQAEAALVLGRALATTDALGSAVAELRRAYFVAMSCGHARTQAKAATELVYAVGYLQQNHGQGHEWVEHALAIVTRIAEGGLIEADVQHVRGVLLDASGDHTGSLVAYERAYELRERLLPANHPDLARSLNALGNIHHSLGDFERARAVQERALELRLALYGPDHPMIAGSLNNLALTLRDSGELDQAKVQLERAVAILERASGAHANGLARSLTNLADIERRLGRFARARELETRSLAIRRASVGDAHPEVADSLVGLARIALAEGNVEQAEVHARDGLARLQRDFALGHPEIFAATLVLASVLEAKGEGDEAARLLVEALADSRVGELEAGDLADARVLLGRLGASEPPR